MRIRAAALCLFSFSFGCRHDRMKGVEQVEGQGATSEAPVKCGSITCGEGQICCNPSCGICTAPDVMCTQQFCDSPEGTSGGAPVVGCDNVRCIEGTHCVLVEVQCVRSPCNPVPECKPDKDPQDDKQKAALIDAGVAPPADTGKK